MSLLHTYIKTQHHGMTLSARKKENTFIVIEICTEIVKHMIIEYTYKK